MTHPLLEQLKKDMAQVFGDNISPEDVEMLKRDKDREVAQETQQAARDANGIMEDCDE